MATLARLIVRPRRIRWTSVVAVMEEAARQFRSSRPADPGQELRLEQQQGPLFAIYVGDDVTDQDVVVDGGWTVW